MTSLRFPVLAWLFLPQWTINALYLLCPTEDQSPLKREKFTGKRKVILPSSVQILWNLRDTQKAQMRLVLSHPNQEETTFPPQTLEKERVPLRVNGAEPGVF